LNVSKSKAKWWLMALSIALGGMSAWALDQHLNKKTEEIESRTRLDQLTLLVASKDLSRDTIIEEADYVAELFPVKWAPDDAVTLEQSEFLVGKRLLTDLRIGQPLMHIHLQDAEALGVSTRLEPGLKAVSVTIDPSSTASGLIRAGDRIDLFVSLDHQGKRLTVVLLQSVEVLGTGQFSDLNTRMDNTVTSSDANITLAVSNEDAVKVVAAREAGSISAVLSSNQRALEGKDDQVPVGDLASLLGLPSPPVSRMIPIIYGDRLSAESDETEIEKNSVGMR
jgi:pilus assembly protein CpaB